MKRKDILLKELCIELDKYYALISSEDNIMTIKKDDINNLKTSIYLFNESFPNSKNEILKSIQNAKTKHSIKNNKIIVNPNQLYIDSLVNEYFNIKNKIQNSIADQSLIHRYNTIKIELQQLPNNILNSLKINRKINISYR